MPKQGQSVESCVIGEWRKKKGDSVSIGDILFTYETDKAAFEETAKVEGVVLEAFYEEGDDVECLKAVCVIGAEGESIAEFLPDAQAPAVRESAPNAANTTPEGAPVSAANAAPDDTGFQIPNPAPATPDSALDSAPVSAANAAPDDTGVQIPDPAPAPAPASAPALRGRMNISPRARALAEKTGADISRAVPTGANDRVMERDIYRLIEDGRFATRPAGGNYSGITGTGIGGRVTTFDTHSKLQEPDSEVLKLGNVRKVIAKAMHASISGSAQLTLHSSFDATDIFAFRKNTQAADGQKETAKITVTDIIVYAVSRVILEHKSINSHFLGDTILQYNNAHIGVAVDTPRGLLVPTLHGANSLSLAELSAGAKELFEKCRLGTIEPDSLKGASFTVSNLGGLGIEMFTPILNPPQTGLLGVCCAIERTKGGRAYPAIGLSLTFDHRALDGADAAKFLKDLVQYLESFSVRVAAEGCL